jgi:hypothetical protein
MTKSPPRLVRQALATGKAALPVFSSRFSRHDFTRSQLFAILILKYFLRTDYRGVVAVLAEWTDPRHASRLKKVPRYPTLRHARQRLLGEGKFERLLAVMLAQAQERQLISNKPEVAIDATGWETQHVGLHHLGRGGKRRFTQKSWPQLTAVYPTATHLIGGAVVGRGPSQDSPEFTPAMRQASAHPRADRVLGDKASDAEHNHRPCREELGIRSTLIPINKRNTGRKWPKTKYRRQMRGRFFKRKYGQRWQAESGFSRHKRRLGSALTTCDDATQRREMLLRVPTHNLMILRRNPSRISTEQGTLRSLDSTNS